MLWTVVLLTAFSCRLCCWAIPFPLRQLLASYAMGRSCPMAARLRELIHEKLARLRQYVCTRRAEAVQEKRCEKTVITRARIIDTAQGS